MKRKVEKEREIESHEKERMIDKKKEREEGRKNDKNR